MMTPVNIRPLQPTDEAIVHKIAKDWQGPQFHWPVELLKTEFVSSQGWGLFAPDLCAFILLADRGVAWELTCLATRKEAVKKGHMRALLQAVIEAVSPSRELWLEVHENNLAARNLYEKLGFTATGRRAAYYRDGGAAIMYTLKVG